MTKINDDDEDVHDDDDYGDIDLSNLIPIYTNKGLPARTPLSSNKDLVA